VQKKSNRDKSTPKPDKKSPATASSSSAVTAEKSDDGDLSESKGTDAIETTINTPRTAATDTTRDTATVEPTNADSASSAEASSAASDAKRFSAKTTAATPSSGKPSASKSTFSQPDRSSTPETSVASSVAKTVAVKKTASKPAPSRLAIVALILAVAGLAIIGYGYSLIQKLQIQQSEQVSALKSQLDDSNGINRQLQQQNGQILGELNQIRSSASAQDNHVNELQNRLAKAMQQVSKLGTDTRKDWLLAEVEYLLRLANQRVLMERTASGALSLLKGADKILQETEDVSIYPVRKALALDILALEAVPTLDIEGMFLKLVAIDSQLDHLRLLPTTDKHQLPELLQQITSENMSQSWQDGINRSWSNAIDKLGKLIVIRHREDPVTPLLSPEQHYFLTQNLHLMLEQTQLALLQGKQQAFDSGLTKATVWIGTYFEASDPTTQALVQNLSALQGTEISPTLPNISGSLNQLNTYLIELHNLEGAAR
jgi:uroporphyrin-3 C-methyltransferase